MQKENCNKNFRKFKDSLLKSDDRCRIFSIVLYEYVVYVIYIDDDVLADVVEMRMTKRNIIKKRIIVNLLENC